ncbi:chorismate synthase [Candidatus Bathyarchaeota archaeon]|jgi:chorismate synthase|nr:chorismate synthase [Candidatus Bathyarchaeota archaeon]MBT4320836.1 chorismate synthase [Candidatus Bathyarchaeota archaeon]MBT4423110.1 chorismate synthase [Candidatus Bathyarchaeota archaeon]MBT6605486.1 chorismate synthase [Candidatus Bathyarchaeota archaeon]MBT7186144.1 chorismate synthase [Candidatus Bathyarchaeota archaeon]
MNTLGTSYRITSIGESHGKVVGVVIDGCPAGLELDMEKLQADLDRRRPGQSSVSTTRNEADKAEVLTGLYQGVTTGAPITIIIRNRDRDSSKYLEARWTPRPGHADYTAGIRYGEKQDPRGGGRFSGRNTAGFVIAGAVAKQLLDSIGANIIAYTYQIGSVMAKDVDQVIVTESNIVRCPDESAAQEMIRVIDEARSEGDSVGGKVKVVVLTPPSGIGHPIFDTLEGDIAKALYAIPAVKAVEFGVGVGYAEMRGSEANDQYIIRDGKVVTVTNNSGGILGGISSGMPIEATVTFKPTPSIGMEQKTVDLQRMEETTIKVEGRHDPCIVPRAVPVVEAMMAVVLADHALRAGLIPQVLGE